jgi:tetratricopeptide (TPR) repeat protein
MPSIRIHSLLLRALLSIVIALLASIAIYRGYGIYRADRIVRSGQTVENYNLALKYDPGNPTLWWNRGRLWHYSVQQLDLAKAAADYQRALDLNPRLSQAWVDRSDCLERMGRYREAETALENAFAAHRYSPLIRWQAGNFFLRRGNLPKMYECFRIASQYEADKLAIAIDTAWKIDDDHAGILEKLVPDDINSNLSYLGFLVGLDELNLAAPAWRRCRNNTLPDEFEFKPSLIFPYIDRLLAHSRAAEAKQVWEEAIRKSGFAGESKSGNLIWNGSFENEILRGGFDWRYPETTEVRFRVESGNRMDKLRSLHITFIEANISAGFLNQIVQIPKPGKYILDFYVRTDGLTTDQLPYAAIQGFPDAAGTSARSACFPATEGWSKVSIPFTVAENCHAIDLALRRDRSSRFDCQIKGSLWLDGFVISAQ